MADEVVERAYVRPWWPYDFWREPRFEKQREFCTKAQAKHWDAIEAWTASISGSPVQQVEQGAELLIKFATAFGPRLDDFRQNPELIRLNGKLIRNAIIDSRPWTEFGQTYIRNCSTFLSPKKASNDWRGINRNPNKSDESTEPDVRKISQNVIKKNLPAALATDPERTLKAFLDVAKAWHPADLWGRSTANWALDTIVEHSGKIPDAARAIVMVESAKNVARSIDGSGGLLRLMPYWGS